MHVQLLDYPGENIMSHLAETTKFIEEALAGGGKVFIHWYVYSLVYSEAYLFVASRVYLAQQPSLLHILTLRVLIPHCAL